ncbi:glycosyltransferase [Fimbriimonas ginsengisoli]|uniref:Group 1 glycosyl transferase n=1 Tax=Fimbriimonas ginsengisoli Gsoil 348 TaxID=661478 RepID=A0A068NY58_FIMGI|nr:glycosyltransferase [Fimbriimonas ginsengisoli]AIE86664.1 group 1 glycosyl transferase [Fimbriimonas ginsengisoli Gsoil 348]
MRILQVVSSIDPATGGPSEVIRQQARAFIELGHSMEVATCDAPGLPFIDEFPCKVHPLGPGSTAFAYAPDLHPWLLKNAAGFDAVIMNGLWQYTGFATWRAMRKLGRPYVVFTHGMLDPWFKHTFPLKHLKKSLYWPWGEYRVLRDAKSVLFTCEDERVLARQSFKLYKANERVATLGITNPSGIPEQQRAVFFTAFPQLEGKRILLYLSRIHPKKGCDLLITAFAEVCATDKDLALVVAGPDQVGWMGELQRLSESLGIAERVHWPGMLTGDLKWGAYHASEAFILPSHQENFGIVVAEALACGRPVLLSRKVNIWREIAEDKAGFVAEDTLEGTRELLVSWLDTAVSEKLAMSDRAKQCFESRFEIKKSARGLLEILEEMR